MNIIANAFYNKMLGHYIRFRPCVYAEHTEEFRCHMCGSLLEYAYMEQRLYVVRCPYCSMVTLVKAPNPREAAVFVGYSCEVDDE